MEVNLTTLAFTAFKPQRGSEYENSLHATSKL